MIIIFDYNRTLFDPENSRLYEGVFETLKKLSKKHKLFLLSYNEFGREKFMKDVKIDKFFSKISLVENKNETNKFFSKISLVENKNETNMSALIENSPADITFVIGDSLRNEICIGNKLGYETVWFKKGKFASELPTNKYENPKYTINSIEEILIVLKKFEKK